MDKENNNQPNLESDCQIFGRYQLVSKLGTGGMGDVYKAYDPNLKRHVALKILRYENPEVLERFLREARAQAQVEHIHICKIYEAGECENRHYIAMQYIDGKTLTDLKDRLNIDEKIKIMKDVALGLHAAHRQGLIHRDVKSSNIIVKKTEEGQWKPFVMDFGIAREQSAPGITSTGMVVGTPFYMSPEQAKGKVNEINRRSDVYSLGITLFELLSGEVPFKGDTPVEILMKIIQKDPPPLRKVNSRIPVDLETIVMKCIEKDPNRRYGYAKELAEDLQRYLDGDPITARQPTIIYRLKRKILKYKWATLLLGIALIVILCFTGLWIHTKSQASKKALIAQQLGQEVEKIESIIHYAHLLPLHNISREKNKIRERMRKIEDQMKQVGKIGFGPGHYAMGRGFMALQEYGNARLHLQKSWDSGYQTPEVAYELGRALGELYLKESEKMDRIDSRELREIRKKEVEQSLRKPAAHYLRFGAQIQSELKVYIEALIGFYEENYSQALRKLKQAIEQADEDTPWLYEANLLEGNIYFSIGNEQANSEQAKENFNRAELAYAHVMEIGESDTRGYVGLSRVIERMMMIKFFSQGGDLQPLAEKALQHCEKALKIDPEIDEIYVMKSSICRWLGRYQMIAGQNPLTSFNQSISLAEDAIRRNPENIEAFTLIGITNRLKSEYKMNLGEDPLPEFQVAIANFNKVLKISPAHVMALNGLGDVYVRQSEYEINQGKDPRESLARSIDSYTKALKFNPDAVHLMNGLACAFWFKGGAKMTRGQDPRPEFSKATEYLEHAIKINPGFSYFYSNLGFVLYDISRYELNHGLNPINHVNQAMSNFRKALKLNPKGNELHLGLLNVTWIQNYYDYYSGKDCSENINRAWQYFRDGLDVNPNSHQLYIRMIANLVLQARTQQDRGESPITVLEKTDALLSSAKSINPKNYEVFSLEAEIFLLRACWNFQQKQNPENLFICSGQSIKKALELNPKEASSHLIRAKLNLKKAEWRLSLDRFPQDFIAAGLSAIQDALSINPSLAEAFLMKGELELLKSKAILNSDDRDLMLKNAFGSFSKGIRINRNLKLLVEPCLKEITRLRMKSK
jgi:serine/threonine protein kinase